MINTTTRNVLDEFDAVNRLCDKEGYATPELSESHRFLMQKYDLTANEVEFIALLLQYYPDDKCFTPSALQQKGIDDAVVKNLSKRQYIDINDDGFNLSPVGFSIKASAYGAFCINSSYDNERIEDCFKELQDMPNPVYCSDQWLQMFNRSLALPANAQFETAAHELDIINQNPEIQKAFWMLVWRFIHSFDEGESRNDDNEVGLAWLVKAGIATTVIVENDTNTTFVYNLSPKAVKLLFYGREEVIQYNSLGKYATIIKCRDIAAKELYFSAEAQSEIDKMRFLLSPKGYDRAVAILRKRNRPLCIHSLLWGTPGTGKTETIKQLALESGRDVIQFEVSKVMGSGWGVTEKAYRSLFLAYRYVVAISEKTPILLLNEADDILSKRLTSFDRAIDKSYNTVSNILLEELENLDGILLATTNLLDNIDEAFDRRFLFKIRLTKPDASARAKIWKSRIEELSDFEVEQLANNYEMSGAQIDNVVARRDLAELYFEGDRGVEFISKLCAEELLTEKGSKAFRKSIGF